MEAIEEKTNLNLSDCADQKLNLVLTSLII